MHRLIEQFTAVMTFVVAMAASAAGAEKFSATGKDFEVFLASLPPNNAVQSALARADIQRIEPVFVFIPGILGSKLVLVKENKEEEVVWGCVNNVILVSDNLSYDVAPKLSARPLLGPDSQPGDCAFKNYKIFFEAMTYSGLAQENPFLNFAYDWRQGNDESAKDLDDFIRHRVGDLRQRQVVFVAHSMGGLVFKWWYFHHYQVNKSDYPFDIAKVYFVGTPHNGSYAAVDALKHGYTLLANAGTFFGRAEQKIAPALNRHGLTFPSFYQLLPVESAEKFNSWYKMPDDLGGHQSRIDLMTANAWRRLGLPNTANINLPPHVTTREQFYEGRLNELLGAALVFHKYLSAQPVIENARYAFSDEHETPNGLVAKQSPGANRPPEITISKGMGDGTVFSESAQDVSRNIDTDRMIWLNKKHPDLVTDNGFIKRLFQLRDRLAGGWEGAAAREWQNDDTVISLLAKNGVLLPTAAWRRTETVKISENEELGRIGSFNLLVLDQMAKNRGQTVDALSAKLYKSAKAEKNPQAEQELYQSYIAIEKILLADKRGNIANYGWAQNNLGYSVLRQGNTEAALIPLKNAKEIAVETNMGHLEATSSRNLKASSKF